MRKEKAQRRWSEGMDRENVRRLTVDRRMRKIHLGGEQVTRWEDSFSVRMGVDLRASREEKLALVGSTEWQVFVNKMGNYTNLVHGGTELVVQMRAHGGEVFRDANYIRNRAFDTLEAAIKDLPDELRRRLGR